MNIEAMAREAGLVEGMSGYLERRSTPAVGPDFMGCFWSAPPTMDDLANFAALVRAAAMREAAGICTVRESDHYHDYKDSGSPHKGSERSEAHADEAANCAAAILAAIDQPKEK